MIFREVLYNEETQETRPGNILENRLDGDIEQITIDSSVYNVKYYYVHTPNNMWKKTQFYELVDNLYTVTYMINDTVYDVYYLLENESVTAPTYTAETGYEWSGWLNNVPSVMPAANLVINSTLTHVSYNLVYFIDNRVVHFEPHYYGDELTEYVPEARDGYVFSGWTGFPEPEEEGSYSNMPAQDVIVTGSYTANNSYTLTYMIDSSVYSTVQYKAGELINSAAEQPDIETGYSWTGWINEPATMPAQDYTVNSSLVPNDYALDYYVDSSLWKSVTYPYKSSVTPQYYTPPTGKQFSGWYNEPTTMPAVDHYEVTGKTGYNMHDVTFMIDSSTVYASYKFAYGDPIPELEIQKEGFIFLGWEPAVPQYMGNSDILTYAQIVPEHCTVSWYTIDNNDMTTAQLLITQTYNYGDSLIVPEYPERIGWDSSVMEPESTTVLTDFDCYINYDRQTYQIYYYVDESLLKTASYAYDASIDNSETATKKGYTFTGWNPPVPARMPLYDISTYAQFDINNYNIYYYIDSSLMKVSTYAYDEVITDNETASKSEYVFTGWNPPVPARMPDYDIQTSAQFLKRSWVYWYIDSSLIASGVYNSGTIINSPLPDNESYVYNWGENNIVYVGDNDVSIYGEKIYLDTSIFGISIEQYHENVATPQVDLGYCEYVDDGYHDTSTDSNLYGFVYLVQSNMSRGSYLPAVFRYQISTNGEYWTDANNVQFDTNNIDKTIDSDGIVHLPELSSFKYIRIVLKNIEGTFTQSEVQNASYFGIVIGSNRVYNSSDRRIIRSTLVLTNQQDGCKFQVFGNYDSFYSYLQQQLNTIFDSNLQVHGVLLSLSYNVRHAHNAYEHTAHNFITSGYRWWGTDAIISLGDHYWGSAMIETLPVNKATDLYPYCYSGRWSGCINILTPPELPATTLAEGCYTRMFDSCEYLQSAPELPATTLATRCYHLMFSHCKSIKTPPELPATTLSDGCYLAMFRHCSFKTAPELPATTVFAESYSYMFGNCGNLNYPPVINGTIFNRLACAGMFIDCTSLRRKADITVTDASTDAFDYMYDGCTSLPPED